MTAAVSALEHVLAVAALFGSFALGVLISGVLLTFIFRSFFRRLDASPRPWYERPR